jgi:Fibronectin type III domain
MGDVTCVAQMRPALAAMLFGALALVATGATAPTSVSAMGVDSRSVQPAPPGPAGAPQIFHWQAPVPARQLHLGGSRSPNAPLFLGRSSASAPAASSPRSSTPTAAPAVPRVPIYDGLNKPGISATDDTSSIGFAPTPPDSTGAIGRTHYVEMANSIIHVWGRDLSDVSSSPLATLFGASNVPLCDPQIQWDATADRWLAVFLFCDLQSTTQGFYYGWSKTADPSDLVNGWCIFGEPTGSLIFDYPKLGHNSLYMIFGGNFYDDTTPSPNPPFLTAAIAWAALPASGVTTCSSGGVNGTGFPLLNGDGTTQTFTPVPVNTMTNAANGYIVSAYDPAGNIGIGTPGPQTNLAVWHLDSGGILHQDADVPVASFSAPAPASQLGSTNKIDTLDGRLTQAVGDPTSGIWTQHTVANGALSMVAWYQLTASGTNLVRAQEGIVASSTDSIFNAAISPSTSGRGTVIEYSRSSATIDPVIAAQGRFTATATGQMAPGEIVLAGSSAADSETVSCNIPAGFPCRWGDYSAATPDPVQPDVVWGTNMFITSNSATPSWSNQNFALLAVAPPGAPTITAVAAGDGFACVRWTPSTSDSGPDSYTIRAYQGVTVVRTVTINAPATAACVNGLTNGTAYTLTVAATNIAGPGPESAPSASVKPMRGASGSPTTGLPTRTPVMPAPTAPPPSTR